MPVDLEADTAAAATDEDVWDRRLPPFVRRLRAGMHTSVTWEPLPMSGLTFDDSPDAWIGYLSGAAHLGPMAGWGMQARCHPAPRGESGWRWDVTIHAQRMRGPARRSVVFRLGGLAEAPPFPGPETARRAFEDLCRGERVSRYRVQQSGERWWPLRQVPALISGAASAQIGEGGPAERWVVHRLI